MRDVVLATDAAAVQAHVNKIKVLDEKYQQSAAPLYTLFAGAVTADEKAALSNIKDTERRVQPLIAKVMELRSAEQFAQASSLLATMAAINESSKKIVDIIGVIDSIAFQTNIWR